MIDAVINMPIMLYSPFVYSIMHVYLRYLVGR